MEIQSAPSLANRSDKLAGLLKNLVVATLPEQKQQHKEYDWAALAEAVEIAVALISCDQQFPSEQSCAFLSSVENAMKTNSQLKNALET